MGTFPTLEVLAPVSGPLVPLECVPDPVFAGKVVGEGVAIDPVSDTVLAPFDGEIAHVHRARHALTLRSDLGPELLVHVGIDTVQLGGEGFEALVRQGERVRAGQPLLRFAPDPIARRARSLLTEVIVAGGHGAGAIHVLPGPVRAGIDVVLRVEITAASGPAPQGAAGKPVLSARVRVPNPSGLHARPAAVLAQAAKRFSSEVRLLAGSRSANAKSVTAILLLSVQSGDEIRIEATGADAQRAAGELSRFIEEGCGEAHQESQGAAKAPAAPPREAAPRGAAKAGGSNALPGFQGVRAAPGIALGRILQLQEAEVHVEERGSGLAGESAKLQSALSQARSGIEALRTGAGDSARARILEAHLEVLEDPDLLALSAEEIARGHSAGFAWRAAYTALAERLQALESALLRERANDIRDVGRRVLEHLGTAEAIPVRLAPDSILVADDVAPSLLAGLSPGAIAAVCTTGGGATSHVAILARALGIPCLCGVDPAARLLAEGTRALVDADAGRLVPDPAPAEVARAEEAMRQRARSRERDGARAHEGAATRDGRLIEVAANVGAPRDALAAAECGADGVGLLRSEFLFGEGETAPTEDEQARAYREVARAIGPGKRLVVRTLDVGGDKPLAYLPLPAEANPFLGIRGIRVGFEHPEVLRTQLRAILRAAGGADLHIMFPMVATLEELRRARAALEEAQREVGGSARVGIMIEVPSAALCAAQLAPEVDFFSIGTNDLTQYTLAMDRGHPKLAAQADALHPAVLRLIAMTVEAAHAHGRWVGVCGGLAAEELAVPALVGLGIDELSVPPPSVPAIKSAVRALDAAQCRALAAELLAMGTAKQVRERLARDPR